MKLEKAKSIEGKFIKFSPHQSLNEGWEYIKIKGYDRILAFRVSVQKTFLIVEEDGQPYLNENKGRGIEFKTEIITKDLTIEEFEAIKNSGFES